MDLIKKMKYIWFAAFIFLIMGVGVTGFTFMERHEQKEKDHHGSITLSGAKDHEQDHEPGTHRSTRQQPVVNENYKSNCGGCHFAYPPELLPASSWNKILTRLGDHFGESLSLDDLSGGEIGKFLRENAADRSGSKTAGKILRSLGRRSPLRITEAPYIQKKHREISPELFKRKSVGSFSNCLACHKAAEQGDFDDDRAAIPQ
jgi:hypothetical protein